MKLRSVVPVIGAVAFSVMLGGCFGSGPSGELQELGIGPILG